MAKDARLLSRVLTIFLRELFAFFRKQSRHLKNTGVQFGAISFIQRFGSALQLTPHFHVLIPELFFEPVESGDVQTCPLPAPKNDDLEVLVRRISARVDRLIESEEPYVDGALDGVRLNSLRTPALSQVDGGMLRAQRLSAFFEGFSLHAGTSVHENNRKGLEDLCRYGARGPLSLERINLLPNGQVAYRMKRLAPDGSRFLVMSPVDFLARLAALIPPPWHNLVRFHGVLAPNAKLRAAIIPRSQGTPAPSSSEAHLAPAKAPPSTSAAKPKTRYHPWAELLKRTFAVDVLTCKNCGGHRRLVAMVTSPATARTILSSCGLPFHPKPWANARAGPAEAFAAA